MSLFQELADKSGIKTTTTQTLRIVPERTKTVGPRTGNHLTFFAKDAGNCFWRNAVDVAKVVYTRIDARYVDLKADELAVKHHRMKMDEAKKILQEHRNQVFEAVLPLFDVHRREPGHEWTEVDPNSYDGQSADKHAYDYMCQNVFPVMVRTYVAWLPEFLELSDVDTTEQVVNRQAKISNEKLASELRNFYFRFKLVVTPARKA